jgi:hypothetical protein
VQGIGLEDRITETMRSTQQKRQRRQDAAAYPRFGGTQHRDAGGSTAAAAAVAGAGAGASAAASAAAAPRTVPVDLFSSKETSLGRAPARPVREEGGKSVAELNLQLIKARKAEAARRGGGSDGGMRRGGGGGSFSSPLSSLSLSSDRSLEELRVAIASLQHAEQMHAAALTVIQRHLPRVEDSVFHSTESLQRHRLLLPSRAAREELRGAEAQSHRAASDVREAMGHQALHDHQPWRRLVSSAEQLVGSATQIWCAHQQVNATLSAHSDAHNSAHSLLLRVMAIDPLRQQILSLLSLRELWLVRRVCRDFNSWSHKECAAVPSVPYFNQSAYGGIGMVDPQRLQTHKLDHVSATRQDSAIAVSACGDVYRTGGFVRDGSSMSDPVATDCCDVWMKDSADGRRRWRTLPPLPTARTHARACAVPVAPEGGGDGADVALVVVGGRTRRISGEDLRTVEMMRGGSWVTVRTPVSPFHICLHGLEFCPPPAPLLTKREAEEGCRVAGADAGPPDRAPRLRRLRPTARVCGHRWRCVRSVVAEARPH